MNRESGVDWTRCVLCYLLFIHQHKVRPATNQNKQNKTKWLDMWQWWCDTTMCVSYTDVKPPLKYSPCSWMFMSHVYKQKHVTWRNVRKVLLLFSWIMMDAGGGRVGVDKSFISSDTITVSYLTGLCSLDAGQQTLLTGHSAHWWAGCLAGWKGRHWVESIHCKL